MEVSFLKVQSRIYEVAKLLNLKSSPRIVAVSKFHSTSKIQSAIDQGACWFGESYLSELEEKYNFFKSSPYASQIHWSFIGHLQSNKIARIVNIVDEIQSVESIKHVRYISKYAKICGKIPFPIYIELNLEPQKGGVSFLEVEKLYKDICSVDEFKNTITVEGIMCVPPLYEEKLSIEDIKNKNIQIPQIYKQISKLASSIGNKKLSLGMSSDMLTSMAVGSTTLRIGTSIFGERHY